MQRSCDRIWWLVALAGLVPAGVARANDSAAGLDGGQLVLKQADHIRMESEALLLSMKEVRVRYEFRNTGPSDVETIVAFPLPCILMPYGEPRNDCLYFLSFGRPGTEIFGDPLWIGSDSSAKV